MPANLAALDPPAPSKAGLIPGDLIYYHDDATGTINHTVVYVGQEMQTGGLVDVVDQHAWGNNKFHSDWMPDRPGFNGGKASVEFVYVSYPGE
jgi:cell wall-associated NlpC family hydrolase